MLVVTVMLLLISATAVGLLSLSQIEYRVTKLRGEEIALENLAQSAETYLWEMAKTSAEQRQLLAGPAFNPELNRPIDLISDDPLEPKFAFYPLSAGRNQADLKLGWENESNKLNLLELGKWEQAVPGQAMKALLEIPGMNSDLANRIIAAIGIRTSPSTEDELATPGNLRLEPFPFYPTPPGLLEELAVRCDTDLQLWFGSNKLAISLPHTSAEERFPDESVSSIDDEMAMNPILSDYLTLVSQERNESFVGKRRVFLNQTSLRELHAALTPVLGKEFADFVVLYRQYGPADGTGLDTVSDLSVDFTKPAMATFESELDLIGATVTLILPSGRQVRVNSPIANSPSTWNRRLQQIFDQVTVDSRGIIPGRINLLTASREVLLAIPGMDYQRVDQILAARSMADLSGTEFFHPVWILERELVDTSTAKQVLPYLTTSGDVLRARIEAFYPQKNYRVQRVVVVDGTNSIRGRIYTREIE